MDESDIQCPFHIGDRVRFSPSQRTLGHYQNIAGFGVEPGEVIVIAEIRGGCYLYSADGKGGWPWNELVTAD